MSDDPTPKPAETPAPQFLTKADVEAMISAQTAQLMGMIQRQAELIAPAPPAAPAAAPVSFYDNPDKAAAALFEAKIKPVRDAYVAGERSRQLNEVSALPFAGEYMGEIKDIMDRAPAELVVQPGYARETYNLVIGRHFDEVTKKKAEAEARKPEFTETVTAGAPPTRKSNELSADEKRAAEGMGIPPDEYRKWRDDPDKMAAAALAAKRS